MKKKLLFLSFIAFNFFHPTISVAKIASTHRDEINLKTELSSIQKDIQLLEKNVSSHQKQEEILSNELASIEKSIGDQSEQLRTLENQKTAHQKTLKQLEEQIHALQTSHQAQEHALTNLIRDRFYYQPKEGLELLFGSLDSASRIRQEAYYRFFSLARSKEIARLTTQLKEAKQLELSLRQEQALLDETSRTIIAKKEKLHTSLQQRKNVLVALTHDLKSYSKRMAYLQQQEHHLEKLFKKLQSRLSGTVTYIDPTQDFAKMKHQLPLPILENDVTFSVLPNLNLSSAKKTYINAPNGTPVSAIFPGRVVFAEWLRGVGLLIILDHGNGYLSLYGNNQKLYKGVGDWVSGGEMIARVGQSGGHSEPGLYFEIRKDGKTLDPTPWFSDLG